MKSYDVVVIGGSAAGLPAGITARRHYSDKSILLIRKEGKVPIPCGIPYVFGTVHTTDKNLISDASLEKNGIDLMIEDARSIDRDNRVVTTASGESVGYDKLILATGSEPLQLPILGIDKGNVFYARKDVPYLDALLDRMKGFRDVVVLGGGFIGVEFADEMKKMGVNVTIVELLSYCLMLAFEEELCSEAETKLKERGVEIITGAKLIEVLGDENISAVKLSDGREIQADMLLVGVGVRPNSNIATDAGLEVTRSGIVVDNHQRTSDEHIFACGDCTAKRSFFTGKDLGMRLASIASMEARIAGANLFRTQRENPGVVGVFSTAIGDLVLATAGLSEKLALENGFEVVSGVAEAPNRHPGGMPGMASMKVKLVFNKSTGELLGGTARGGPSVGELINTVSACIQKKMTADDIATFQLGTHPAVTASPIAYQLVNAAEIAKMNMQS